MNVLLLIPSSELERELTINRGAEQNAEELYPDAEAG